MKFIILLCFAPVFCFSQSSITSEDRQKANNFYTSNDWQNAAVAYKKIADAEPQNWNARTRLGVSLTSIGKANEAIKPLEEAVKIGNGNQSMYYLASAYAATGKSDQAFQWLEQSIKNGFNLLTIFDTDKAFLSIKADPRYNKNRELMLQAIYPCRYSEKSREFDFWIGEWDVKNTQGQPAGKSKIEIMLGDCVILENWTSAPPNLYAGKSINLFNPTTKKWIQTWFDDKGGIIEFINGEYKDNKMVFITLPDAQKTITRLTFYKLSADLMRQQFETTTDEGKTWTTTTDLQYHRVR